MSIIRDPVTMFAMLEGGTFGTKLRAEMTKVVKTLSDLAGEKGTAKGTLNLKIKFDMKGQTCEITPEVSSKLPMEKGMPETLFVTRSGELSDEHPRQLAMFPRKTAADEDRDTGTDD